MSSRFRRILWLSLCLGLVAPGSSRAGYVWVGPNAKYISGVDAGLGPGWSPSTSPDLQSVQAANQFGAYVANVGGTSSTVDFGAGFTNLRLSGNGLYSQSVDTSEFSGIRATTTGIDYGPPPSPYQYGIATSLNAGANTRDVGYGVGVPGRYQFVPALGAPTASYTIHSDTAFEAFGVYVTGLGNVGGVVQILLNGQPVSGISLKGSTLGGAQFLGYIGNTPIHDLSFLMASIPGGGRDVFALSDVQLVTIAAVPAPPSAVMLTTGVSGVLVVSAFLRRGRASA